MTPIFRLLLTAVVGFFVIAGAEFPKANAAADLPADPILGGELESRAYDAAPDRMPERAAKIALGNNANAVLSLDLIADGGAGNQRDDGVTTSAVSGRGAKIAIEVFATGVRTSLVGVKIKFDFDASMLSFSRAENSGFPLALPEGSTGVSLASASPVTLASSGFLARAEFETVSDVSGRVFSIGIESVTLAESSTYSDVLTTNMETTFNSMPFPDFDGDGTVGFPDFLAFAGSFGSSRGDARYEAQFDLDGDGSVAFSDFLIFAGDFGSQVPPSGGGDAVNILDDNLRAVIADSLGKAPDAPITREEMVTLTLVDASNKGILSLSGLEHAANLRGLYLGEARLEDGWGQVNSNDISDLSPLSGLTNLAYLVLSKNSISNISALSSLTGLTDLFLNENSITDISVLSNLTNLERLGLGENRISNISALFNLTRLISLDLHKNRISNISALSNLTNLISLDLYENSISNLSALSDLTNLTTLFLDYNSISDVSALSNLTDLTRLGLESNSISDISKLSNLTDLVNLNLWNNAVSNISALTNLTNLKFLYLVRNTISDISALSNLTNLEILRMEHNRISDISSLVANTGLGSGDSVDLRGNPLSDTSRNTYIPTLQRRGVKVEFDGGGGASNLGACRVGLVVRLNQSCTVSGGSFRNIGGGCYNYTPFGSGRICSAGFNLNGLQGTRMGDDFRITAVP